MKRFAVVLTIVIVVVTVFGCSISTGGANSITPTPTAVVVQTTVALATTPNLTAMPEPSPSPIVSTAEPTDTDTAEPVDADTTEPPAIIPSSNVYTSAALGITFAVPKKWVGKYRVVEGDSLLSVYFNPKKPIGENSWTGELFSILMNPSDDDRQHIDGEWQFEANGATYIWGFCDDMPYGDQAPEYNRFTAMQNDVSGIYQTLRSTSNLAITNAKRLQIEITPKKENYITTLGLGITFTLPKFWIGKCCVIESSDVISFSFLPKKPDAERNGNNIFTIEKKTDDTASDENCMDGVQEFVVNGVTYFSGGATDVEYEGPEQKTYNAMFGGIQDVVNSVRAAK